MSAFYELAERAIRLKDEGRKIIRLDIGQTNRPVAPEALEKAEAVMKKGRSDYGPAAGLEELRAAIAEREGCETGNVAVGPGSKHLLFAVLSLLAKRGDAVLVPSPHWPAYHLMGRHLGLKMDVESTSFGRGWQMDGHGFDGQKALILCNPNNPTSTVQAPDVIEELAKKAARAGAAVIIDEAYRGLAFKKIESAEGAIRVRSFSKEFNMEGWRLGYAVGPKEVIARMTRFNQFTITCVPDFVQAAGLACLAHEERILEENLKAWKRRAALAGRILKKGGFEFVEPRSGIYIFARHPKVPDSAKLAGALLDEGIAVAAGHDFGRPEFIRICPNLDEEELAKALEKVCEVANRHGASAGRNLL